ncbi:MAG TPA: glycosyltransferase [Terracidiphilus sp.]|nr:glycosyltransferase [Terracidiphilus sp.]
MKICMLAYAHYLNDARIKSYVQTLEDHGHQVDIVVLRSEGEAAVEPQRTGTIFRVMKKYQGHRKLMYAWAYLEFFLRAFFFLLRRSFSVRYDVIHVNNMPNALVFATLPQRLLGARLFLDVHDLMTANYMAKFNAAESALPVRILRFEQKLSAMFVDHVLCADANQRDYLVESCGIAPRKVSVFLNLPNTEIFGAVREVKAKSTEKFRLVYHGTIAHRLGIDLILRAVAKASERVPVEMWIYGSGDFMPEALALAKELNLEAKVHFSRKFFPVEQIPEIVSGMDMGFIGNRRNLACDRYMLPVKLLEYVYLHIPVIVPRLQVISRYFDDSMVRFYEPENVDAMADAIVTLYHDPEARERYASAAKTFYQTYNIQAQANRYLELVTSSQGIVSTVSEKSA